VPKQKLISKINRIRNRTSLKNSNKYSLHLDRTLHKNPQPIKASPDKENEITETILPVHVAEDFLLIQGDLYVNGFLNMSSGVITKTPSLDTDITNKKYIDDQFKQTVLIDLDVTATTASDDWTALKIDLDKTGATTTNNTIYGLRIDCDNTTATNGIVSMYGIANTPTLTFAADAGAAVVAGITQVVTGGAPSTSWGYGLIQTVTGSDSNYGIVQTVDNGGIDIELRSSADTGDKCTISTTANGATTIETIDNNAALANLTLDVDGDITLDSHSGNFIAKKAGTEFSAANSSYAGMILGYTYLHPTDAQVAHEIQNSMTVEDASHRIIFKTPPSEKVEIELSCFINVGSTDTNIDVGLSDNSTYNSIGAGFEYDLGGVWFSDDEIDDDIIIVKWVLEAANLASIGSSNTFYIGFSTAGSTKTANISYGVRASHGLSNPPFIVKATALPSTLDDGS